MTVKKAVLFAAFTFALLALGFFTTSSRHRGKPMGTILSPVSWQHTVIPGDLSQGHAFLENNCAACHSPVKGVEAQNCIVCHANNKAVLQRQPTAFHANINSCTACHLEHQGRIPRTTKMDHVALARIAFRELEQQPPQPGVDVPAMKRWLKETKGAPHQSAHPNLRPEEALLNCATCHQTKDRHVGLFGTDCASCHATNKWTISEFRHPSSASQSCAQCHQAPPSHYMEHFNMISKKVAQQEDSQVAGCCGPTDVSQCYRCHQTTSWNDIKGVGYYKHH
jgi:ribosomal protein S14